jgi:hypothetical protein
MIKDIAIKNEKTQQVLVPLLGQNILKLMK